MQVEEKIQADYRNRINKVFVYIDENLQSKLSLEELSDIACFSPFHFHRVFKTITNETLNEYVTRRRIEKSALDLMHKTSTLTGGFSMPMDSVIILPTQKHLKNSIALAQLNSKSKIQIDIARSANRKAKMDN